MSSYDPNSTNAMFATILAEIKELRTDMSRVEAQTTKTNGRVTKLESARVKIGVIFALASAAAAGAWEFFCLWKTK